MTTWYIRLGEDHHLVGPEGLVLGRATDADVVLEGGNVSRRHATLRIDGDVVVCTDENSAHGTKVNGLPLKAPLRLTHGDQITVGDHTLVVLDLSLMDRRQAPTQKITPRRD